MRRALFLLALACGAARAGQGVTIYAAGDIAECPSMGRAAATAELISRQLAKDPTAAVLTLGDNAYPSGSTRDFRECYGPTWGRFKDRTYPSPGNHEYATAGASAYFAYFGRPAYYRIQLGSWRLFSLNSNLKDAAMQAQLDWLRQELAAHPARCTLAYWHHPLYSSGGHGSSPRMHEAWKLLRDAGADLVLSGHDHDYERFAPQDADGHPDEAHGLRQFVVGTGGAQATPTLWPAPQSEWRDSNTSGVLQLRLLDGRYEWSFLPAIYEGFASEPRVDHGASTCH